MSKEENMNAPEPPPNQVIKDPSFVPEIILTAILILGLLWTAMWKLL